MRMMRAMSLVLLLVLWSNVSKASVTTQATFRNYLGNGQISSSQTDFGNEVGYVTIFANLVWYDLDFSAVDWSQFASCNNTEGLSFHIHDKWTYGDSAQSIGQSSADHIGIECHENFTGGHFDPWMACGPTSGNAECASSGGCIPPSSVYEDSEFYTGAYSCDPDNFDLIAYACEIGDLSGKYGSIMAMKWDNTTNETVGVRTWGIFGSYWEVLETVLSPGLQSTAPAQYSLVIHCGDEQGEPLFCAPIVRENIFAIPALDLTDPETIQMDFSEAGAAYENFTITFANSGITVRVPASAASLCNEWYLQLYQDWPYYDDGLAALANCDVDLFGGLYDPTHSCIAGSGSPYCSDGVRCPEQTNISVTYACDAGNNFQGCAVGDISSRIAPIIPVFAVGQDEWVANFPMTANFPPLFILNQRGVLLTCLDGNDENICAGTACDNCMQTSSPTSSAPTTAAPTTAEPTTTALPTRDPTAQTPTTRAPTTASPTTRAPVTSAPVSTSAPVTPVATTTTLQPSMAPTTRFPTEASETPPSGTPPHIHIWDGALAGLNGQYEYYREINDAPAYKKEAPDFSATRRRRRLQTAPSCEPPVVFLCKTTPSFVPFGQPWRITDYPSCSSGYFAWCQRENVTDCGTNEWYSWNGYTGALQDDYHMFYAEGEAPRWDCSSITLSGLPLLFSLGVEQVFDAQIGRNAWRNSQGYVWAFNSHLYEWRLLDGNTQDYRECDHVYLARTTNSEWQIYNADTHTATTSSGVAMSFAYPDGTLASTDYQVQCDGLSSWVDDAFTTTTTTTLTTTTAAPITTTSTAPDTTSSTTTTTTTSTSTTMSSTASVTDDGDTTSSTSAPTSATSSTATSTSIGTSIDVDDDSCDNENALASGCIDPTRRGCSLQLNATLDFCVVDLRFTRALLQNALKQTTMEWMRDHLDSAYRAWCVDIREIDMEVYDVGLTSQGKAYGNRYPAQSDCEALTAICENTADGGTDWNVRIDYSLGFFCGASSVRCSVVETVYDEVFALIQDNRSAFAQWTQGRIEAVGIKEDAVCIGLGFGDVAMSVSSASLARRDQNGEVVEVQTVVNAAQNVHHSAVVAIFISIGIHIFSWLLINTLQF